MTAYPQSSASTYALHLLSGSTDFFDPSHSLNFDQRRRPDTLRTAMTTAFFWPTSTTKLCYLGHVAMENRHGLAVAGMVTTADGRAERSAAQAMLKAKRRAIGLHHGGRRQGL
jgi:hypothetical protein